jgi:hypothetical protein
VEHVMWALLAAAATPPTAVSCPFYEWAVAVDLAEIPRLESDRHLAGQDVISTSWRVTRRPGWMRMVVPPATSVRLWCQRACESA